MIESDDTFGRAPCAIYSRVSTPGQDPQPALADLRRAAAQRGYRVAVAVAETGSGKRSDRPGLERVLAAVRRSEVSALLVTRLDRIGRSALDVQVNVTAIVSAGCELITTEQGLHLRPGGDAMSRAQMGMMAIFADLERELIVDRVREGQARARKRGVVFGRPRENGPEPEAVQRLRAAGCSWAAISRELGCTVSMARRRITAR